MGVHIVTLTGISTKACLSPPEINSRLRMHTMLPPRSSHDVRTLQEDLAGELSELETTDEGKSQDKERSGRRRLDRRARCPI